jgi:hypothetical protein
MLSASARGEMVPRDEEVYLDADGTDKLGLRQGRANDETPKDFPRPSRQLASNSGTNLGGCLAKLGGAGSGFSKGSKNREMGNAHLV